MLLDLMQSFPQQGFLGPLPHVKAHHSDLVLPDGTISAAICEINSPDCCGGVGLVTGVNLTGEKRDFWIPAASISDADKFCVDSPICCPGDPVHPAPPTGPVPLGGCSVPGVLCFQARSGANPFCCGCNAAGAQAVWDGSQWTTTPLAGFFATALRYNSGWEIGIRCNPGDPWTWFAATLIACDPFEVQLLRPIGMFCVTADTDVRFVDPASVPTTQVNSLILRAQYQDLWLPNYASLFDFCLQDPNTCCAPPARHPAVCCGAPSDFTLPDELFCVLTNKTGACVCFPDVIPLERIPASFAGGAAWWMALQQLCGMLRLHTDLLDVVPPWDCFNLIFGCPEFLPPGASVFTLMLRHNQPENGDCSIFPGGYGFVYINDCAKVLSFTPFLWVATNVTFQIFFPDLGVGTMDIAIVE